MEKISDRLREDVDASYTPMRKLRHEAADTIDALVAALQNFVDNDEYCREDYEEAKAALALARGGK